MAVYVILAFADEEQAKGFVKSSRNGDIGYVSPPGQMSPYDNEMTVVDSADVYAVIKKPTQTCDCMSPGKKDGGYSRGTTYGWWIHATCGKPTKNWAHGDDWFTFMGTNLLPQELHPEGAQFTNQPRSPREWSFLLEGKET